MDFFTAIEKNVYTNNEIDRALCLTPSADLIHLFLNVVEELKNAKKSKQEEKKERLTKLCIKIITETKSKILAKNFKLLVSKIILNDFQLEQCLTKTILNKMFSKDLIEQLDMFLEWNKESTNKYELRLINVDIVEKICPEDIMENVENIFDLHSKYSNEGELIEFVWKLLYKVPPNQLIKGLDYFISCQESSNEKKRYIGRVAMRMIKPEFLEDKLDYLLRRLRIQKEKNKEPIIKLMLEGIENGPKEKLIKKIDFLFACIIYSRSKNTLRESIKLINEIPCDAHIKILKKLILNQKSNDVEIRNISRKKALENSSNMLFKNLSLLTKLKKSDNKRIQALCEELIKKIEPVNDKKVTEVIKMLRVNNKNTKTVHAQESDLIS